MDNVRRVSRVARQADDIVQRHGHGHVYSHVHSAAERGVAVSMSWPWTFSIARCLPLWQSRVMTSSTNDRASVWYTVESASKERNVSKKTIRRWIEPVTTQSKHPLRKHFKPTPAKVAQLKENRKTFTWELNGIALDEITAERKKTSRGKSQPIGESGESKSLDLIEYLKTQNSDLKEQLKTEREHNREIQKEQIRLQQAQSVTQGQTNELLQRLTERSQLPGSNEPVLTRNAPPTTIKPNRGLDRVRKMLKKEIHLPFVSRL